MKSWARIPLVVTLATLAALLAGCSRSAAPTPGEVAFGAGIEQARGHLAVALEDAQAGRWELAATHAAHPAEAMPTIDTMLAAKDGAAAASLRERATEVTRASQARDLSALRTAIERMDAQLAAAPAIVLGGARASDTVYRASVVTTLVEIVAEEYGEGVEAGRLANEAEYQDAYAFLQRAAETWSVVEPAVAARAPDEAREVASGLASLRAAMPGIAAPAAPIAADDVETIAHDVQRELREAVGAQAGAATASAREIEDATKDLAATSAALRSGDRTAAATAFREFRSAWLRIEDAVRGRDRDAYRSIETDMATASTLLASQSADLVAADRAVSHIADTLAPLAATTKTYGAFDAAIILLREGFEALLVVAALLAFLARSGNADKRRWVWAGGAAGIGASVVVAILVSVVFSASTAAGVDPELIEGITGVLAAAMLVYMSFWLHSKSNLRAWDRYIRDKSASALARNSLLSLAVIAFLAVFREGSETVLFYFGIASSIATLDLLGGLAAGTAGLAALGVLVLVFGVRVPMRPFFIGASVLVYYLAFKFLGSGIHALQVVGIVPATPAALPDVGILGLFPTWETTAVQIALLAGAAAVIVLGRVRLPSLPSRA